MHTLLRPAIAMLLLVGTGAVAGGLYIDGKAWLGQRLLEHGWQRLQRDPAVSTDAGRPWPWADTYPVARITAPVQHAGALVLAGATGRTLAWGPGHLDGTALPGDVGDAVITAHRDTHFAFLANVHAGDPLVVERRDGSRVTFRVTATTILAADRLAVSAHTDTASPMLTLVTCYPFDALAPGTPWRYVVTAVAISPSAASNGPTT